MLILLIIFNISPRSPTACVYVAVGRNIIWNSIPLNGQVQRHGREPSQRVQRCCLTLW